MHSEKQMNGELELVRFRNNKCAPVRKKGTAPAYFQDVYYWTIILVCLMIHAYSSSVGWDRMILDKHGFRQTQTALSSYYVIQEGFRLDYITPVLGPPWSIPMEFPLYQWVTALLVIITGYDLEKAGRLVSVLFFYFTLIPVFWLSRYFLKKTSFALIVLCLILVNPIYLFWSRTFMIESTALFFCAMYLWLSLRALESENIIYFLLAITCGTLGGLAKATTFAVFLITAFFIYFYFLLENKIFYTLIRHNCRYILYGCLLTLIPLAFSFAWVFYGDCLKADHPFASVLTSSNLKAWNYGTLEQKLSLDVWQNIFELSSLYQSVSQIIRGNSIAIHLGGFIIFTVLSERRRMLFSLAAVYISAPLIFTNLHFRHDYYQYANTIFLCAIIGFFCAELIENKRPIYSFLGKYVVLPGFLILFLNGYFQFYYTFQSGPLPSNEKFIELTGFLKKNTSKEDVIIFIGFDWDSRYAFYSQRKVLMARHIDLEGAPFSRFLNEMRAAGLKAKAVVFSEDEYRGNGAYLKKLIGMLNQNLNQKTSSGSILLITVK